MFLSEKAIYWITDVHYNPTFLKWIQVDTNYLFTSYSHRNKQYSLIIIAANHNYILFTGQALCVFSCVFIKVKWNSYPIREFMKR